MSTPRSLIVASWLFRLQGVLAALWMISALAEPRLLFDFDVLGLWIGPGLLRYDDRYRIWAVRLLVFSMVFSAVVLFALLTSDFLPDFRFFGHKIATVSRSVVLGSLAVSSVTNIWQYQVIRHPNVRALFERSASLADPGGANRDAEISAASRFY